MVLLVILKTQYISRVCTTIKNDCRKVDSNPGSNGYMMDTPRIRPLCDAACDCNDNCVWPKIRVPGPSSSRPCDPRPGAASTIGRVKSELTRKCQHYNHYMTTWPTEITKITETSAKCVDFISGIFHKHRNEIESTSRFLPSTIKKCIRNDVFVSCFFLSILIKVNPPKPELILTLAFRVKTQGEFGHQLLRFKVTGFNI